jgi:hypothetical protein
VEWRVSVDALDYTSYEVKDIVEIDIEAVFRNGMISSTFWMIGLQVSSMDLSGTSFVVTKLRCELLPHQQNTERTRTRKIIDTISPKGWTNDGTSGVYTLQSDCAD